MAEKNVLVVADPHIPFEHKDYLKFCKRIEKAFKCTEVVCTGDLVDNHAISYHEHDPDGWSPADEMKEADKHLRKWYKAFPKVKLCRGNHDRLIDRKSKTVGLPSRAFKDFREIWRFPNGWIDDWSFVIGDVLYTHGTKYSGRFAHCKAAEDNRMSTVIGHLHSVAGVEYSANSRDIIFGMCVGSGIDHKAYAFSYGVESRHKPIVACGVVNYNKHGTVGKVIPMEL